MGVAGNGHDARRAPVVLHDIPGRLRLRWPPGVAPPDVQAIRALPEVENTRWSARTRSLLIVYRPRGPDRTAVTRAVAGALDVDLSARVAPEAPGSRSSAPSPLGPAIRTVTAELDRAVSRATGGVLGLGSLLPAALVAWALAEILRGRGAPLSWSSALWYAHGLLRDYTVAGAE